jgi:exodeoxyribonuclease VII large subunit
MTRKTAPEAPATREQLSLLVPLAPAAPLVPTTAEPPPVVATIPAAPPLPAPLPPPAPRVYTVGEILRAARTTLESRFADVLVEGEISGLKRTGTGHVYFCLKDGDASLDCVLFSREASRLKFAIKEGLAVRCRGRLTLYEARGKFQMTVVDVEPTGAGALALAFEQLKQRLGAAGLFEASRKRKLPFLPRRLGVVTSPQGAVVRDIIRIAHRRFPLAIVVSPAPVQGEGAALAIASALRRLEALPDVDVIIVARGGGSLEDLWAFNEEPVARAIFACRVPVISAVGHETDFTIADFVADLRAPTPSAAAEQAVPVMEDVRTDLANLRRRASRAASESLRAARHGLERVRNRLGDPRRLLDERRQRMDDTVERARRVLARRMAAARTELRAAETRLYRAHPHRRIGEQRGELAAMRHRLEAAIRPALARRRHAVDAACGKLGALSPTRVLERGFSLTQRADGHIVTRAADLAPGERVHVRVREGAFDATVEAGDAPAAKPANKKGRAK